MIQYKHFFGPSIPMNVARVTYQSKSPQLRLFFLLFAMIAALFHPSDQLSTASVPVQIAFWLIGYFLFFYGYRVVLIAAVRFAIARGWSRLYVSGPLELTILGTVVVMYGFAQLVGIPTEDHRDLLEFLLFNVALYELGAFCYIAYADRAVYPEVYDSVAPQPGKPSLHEIFLRGSDLPVHNVEYISAQDNGVVATAGGRSVFIPRPFGLVISELPVDLGLQIHRSLWVSRGLALNLVSDGKKQFILLPDGRRFPIARSRQREYQAWLAQVQKQKQPRR